MGVRHPIEERFWDKVSSRPRFGCWLWTGATNDMGYGQIRTSFPDPITIYAHRFSYELRHGAIPKGLQLDHLCRVPRCVNPCHLEAVTASMNCQRGIGFNKRKTHCPQGHPYSGENLLVGKRGDGTRFRRCRICHCVDIAKRAKRKKEMTA